MEVRKGKISEYAAAQTDADLSQMFDESISFKTRGILADDAKIREYARALQDMLGVDHGAALRFTEESVMEELSRRYVNMLAVSSDTHLQRGDDIFYVNFTEGMIERGKVVYPAYKDGQLDSFSVDFDNGDFDEFVGGSLGKTFFRVRELAEAALRKGEK